MTGHQDGDVKSGKEASPTECPAHFIHFRRKEIDLISRLDLKRNLCFRPLSSNEE